MASSLNLRQYQEGILARLDSAMHADAIKHKSFLGFHLAGERVLVDMVQISEALPTPTLYPAPNTQSWFVGVANVRGNLYAVSDLAAFFGQEAVEFEAKESRILLLHPKVAPHTALLIERLIGLRSSESLKVVEASKSLNQDQESVPMNACFLGEAFEDKAGDLWRVLDCHALVGIKDFVYAGLV